MLPVKRICWGDQGRFRSGAVRIGHVGEEDQDIGVEWGVASIAEGEGSGVGAGVETQLMRLDVDEMGVIGGFLVTELLLGDTRLLGVSGQLGHPREGLRTCTSRS